jgi:hypothetical protein
MLDKAKYFGAQYLRNSGIEFYHESEAGRTVYSSESPDLVCHELGHAILDIVRPEIYNVPVYEQAAFHEAFGDISAILCALQVPQVRAAILSETSGNLNRDSRVSRIGESLGWVLNKRYGNSWSPDYLRNASNPFNYRPPESCPTTGPYTALTSQSHNFCRVFTGAFLEMLAGVFRVIAPQPNVNALQEATFLSAQIIIAAVMSAPPVTAYFAQVAAQMVGHASRVNAPPAIRSQLAEAVSSAFTRRGILSVRSAAAAVSLLSRSVGLDATEVGELPPIAVDANLLSLGNHRLFVRAPLQGDEHIDFRSTGINVEEANPQSAEQAVYHFLEFLLSRGHLDIGEIGDTAVGLAHPYVYKTHAIVEGEDGMYVERLAFGCGFEDC